MRGPVLFRHHLGRGPLVEPAFVGHEPNGVSPDRILRRARHQRHQRTGVEAAAQERADRHVRDHVALDRVAEHGAHLL